MGEPSLDVLVDASAGRDIAGIVLAIFAVVSFIAVVSPSNAPVSGAIASFYHLGFGLGAYVLPFVILMFAAGLFLRDRAPLSLRTCAGGGVIFACILAILSLFTPGTDQATALMFEPQALSNGGGYLGAWIASTLQGALGKSISLVILLGLIVVGLVIIGVSVSSFFQAAADRAHAAAERRRIEVNETPWGDEDALSAAPTPRFPRRARKPKQASLFDDADSFETVDLGTDKTILLSDAEVDENEDPFIDVSDQLAAEQAKTALLASAKSHVAKGDAHAPAASKDNAQADTQDEEIPPFDTAASEGNEESPLPSFLSVQTSSATAPQSACAAKSAHGNSNSDAGDEMQLPALSMLRHNPHSASSASSQSELEQTAQSLQSTLNEFGLHSRVVGWISGPTVTTFKVQPGEGERVSRISNLEDDIALSLAAQSVRIFAPIPGTSLVGIEIPNAKRQNVNLGDVLPYVQGGPLELAIGRDAEGQPIVADLAKMPHLLIAGTTGSGKSVMINSIIMALLMRTLPEDVRLIMVDPKRVELSGYNGLPHLYVPVVTEPKQAASALQWAVSEMERRLKVFERIGVRKISTFNEKQAAGAFEQYDNPPAKMPYLVIIIDELSDLMMVAGKDVEASIVRIAQLGRAAGIHLIVATQRPSSNVVTGLIKANITNRIAFNVATGIDSRVIIDQMGAEKLTGYGDMLFSKVDWGKPKRIQGCFVSDDEINAVTEFVKEQGAPDYHEEILSAVAPAQMGATTSGGSFYNEAPTEDDPLLWDAAQIVVDSQLGSTSGLQRRLKVGYARAGRIMDMLEEKGIVGPPDGSKPREVLLDEEGLAALRAIEEPLSEEEILGGM
ncbi:MAG: DNA translocase FtsK [Coriobacteriaceae bacterium]|nr:DNA translocase FtsK [Coriobacteriaceae bacterium]